MKRKKILLMTDFSLTRSGFGRFAKALLEYLFKLNKFELVHLCVGIIDGHPDLQRSPWKSIGCIHPQKLQEIKQHADPKHWGDIDRSAGYGAYALDEIVKQEKPDLIILSQDIWGIDFATKCSWFNKIPTILSTTLDSRPILPTAIEAAKVSKYFWSWADFATKDMHQLGLKHVETVPGCIDTNEFFPLPESKKVEVRQRTGLQPNDFIIGMVGRNQLRKGFPNLIEGFSIFKKENPEVKNAKLFLHTSWIEGWPIHKYCDQFGVDKKDVLTTYICSVCHNYEIKPFTGHHLDCKFCGIKGVQPNQQNQQGQGQVTTHPSFGISQKQLNEIYNIINAYIHPFTSGGLEIPIIENLLASNALTAITNYSCGEDYCNDPDSGVFPLDWDRYLEGTGTDFVKAWTKPYSIAKTLKKFYNMSPSEKQSLLKKGREWSIKRFSPERIGKIIDDLATKVEFADPKAFDNTPLKKNPHYNPTNNPNNQEWLTELYQNFFGREPDAQGLRDWMDALTKGKPREELVAYFRQVSFKEDSEQKVIKFEDILDKKDKKRLILIQPESAGDIYLCTSLFKSIKERYPEYTFYVATKKEYKSIIDGNPYVDKWIEYSPQMDNHIWLTGNKYHNGYFDIAYHANWLTQKSFNYYNNSEDRFDIKFR